MRIKRGLLLLPSLCVLNAQLPGPTPNQAAAILKRIGEAGPFLESLEARSEPQSLGRFFRREDYRRLRGNPITGYCANRGFRWEGKRFAWLGIRPATPDAQALPPQAWDAALQLVAKRRGLVLDPKGPIRVQGACVAAVVHPDGQNPTPGVCIEVRFRSPAGERLHRFSVGKPSAAEAMAAALDFVLVYAQALDQPQEFPLPSPGPAR